MTGGETAARRLLITGRVQGVGFRFAMVGEARARRLTGWVRNCADGSVEAVVAGAAADVEAIVAWAHRGPPAAQVTGVRVEAASGEFADFAVAPAARNR